MTDVNDFDIIRIGLATNEQITSWSRGEVKRPETINYRTQKPEKDGLFCERIFGPVKDWECWCGKFKKRRNFGKEVIICDKCGVEITKSRVRRERMGHIKLAAPVAHIWFFKGVPSRIGYLLDITPKELESIIYFSKGIVTKVEGERLHEDIPRLQSELEEDIEREKEIAKNDLKLRDEKMAELDKEIEITEELLKGKKNSEDDETKSLLKELKTKRKQQGNDRKRREEKLEEDIKDLRDLLEKLIVLKPKEMLDLGVLTRMRDRYSEYFEGGVGAEAIRNLLEKLDLEDEANALKQTVEESKSQKKAKAIKRLRVVNAFLKTENDPRSMILEVIPVLPPDLRPMVQLDGGRFATTDINDLYRRLINRNNRLKRLKEMGAPEVIVNNEKRMVQEAVDALFDNSARKTKSLSSPGNRPLKSLSDMLRGKQGRFRQNLLGKRVDYSGRSVIVVGPKLKLHQCGLPKQMAIELFKPFVAKKLIEMEHAGNVRSAKKLIEAQQNKAVWDALEQAVAEHPVLLNRAPTLHRLGIQAFEPVLIDGKAIRIHPLVCPAFNADFDGDQMAVHVPLTPEAQAEAKILMLSSYNILSPASGKPLATPTQDMVIGSRYLTLEKENDRGEGKFFSSKDEARLAYDFEKISLHAKILVRIRDEHGIEDKVQTTVGRIIFNEALPKDYPFINEMVGKELLEKIVIDCFTKYDMNELSAILDELKDVGFYYSTKAGITIGIDDVIVPKDKSKIIDRYDKESEKLDKSYEDGAITEEELFKEKTHLWEEATSKVTEALVSEFDDFNPIYMMSTSGARGKMLQIRQLGAMRGLVTNPKGELIDYPIKSNFKEGLSVLEYFMSTHGARKGLVDTALRTAESGYLTRRMVDVAQDVVVRDEDCGTEKTIEVSTRKEKGETNESLLGRFVIEPIVDEISGEEIVPAGGVINMQACERIAGLKADFVPVRSVLTCESRKGICRLCYGWSLSDMKLVEKGEAVGIMAAQSIGEPGTQLTMRTFHTGGVSGKDITQGLPRVQELLEARKPKAEAPMAEIGGIVKISEDDPNEIAISVEGKDDTKTYKVRPDTVLFVENGESIEAGRKLTEGDLDPKKLIEICGPEEAQLYLVRSVHHVYESEGADIHDKHIEMIVRQMTKKVQITEPGDSDFLPGQFVDKMRFEDVNEDLREKDLIEAKADQQLLGITKAALNTESFLSAASFQETTRVLTDAAIEMKSDPLIGIKENVIIGKLIPAGTGMSFYRNINVDTVNKPQYLLKSADYADEEGYESQFEGDYEIEEYRGSVPDDDIRDH